MLGAVIVLVKLGTWVGTIIAARWGYKLALIAAVVAMFGASYAAVAVLATSIKAAIESVFGTFGPLVLQFLPTTAALSAGAALYLGTLATLKALEYWRAAWSLSVRVAAPL